MAALSRGKRYELVLRVQRMPLELGADPAAALERILTDVGFVDARVWRVGEPPPPFLVESSPELVASFPAWLTHATGTWGAPSRDQRDDLGEMEIVRIRELVGAPSARGLSGLEIAGVLVGSGVAIAAVVTIVSAIRGMR